MASLPQPSAYYPNPASSIMHAQPSTAASKGSFGPVFAVLAVICFLAVAACVIGRLCGRRFSKKKSLDDQYYGSNDVGGDLEKGFEIKYPSMKPMASSRAMIHDIDDGFEIKFAPGKPAAWKNDNKANNKGYHHHPQPGMPKGYAVPKEYAAAGFRYPADAVIRQGQIRGGTFIPAKPST
ncbi:hypothetical protein PR202_ga02457 [Eleusine coracana subsp. coracana]|uniref:Uncharacterized protein n=1 Tax=Eleusine coracana subsp. coracana TaxID=191504 RepID=A0AAV5BK69_ELECO|nr:hypothetical protein QOZ80_2AG0142650 [Eleusine coracana subsp. coracana]GJM86586.1 hypothetical protein PR202_ga02457 [Eleusine coracana subsp. coracana]